MATNYELPEEVDEKRLECLEKEVEMKTFKSNVRVPIPCVPEACLALSSLSCYTPLMSLIFSLAASPLVAVLRPVSLRLSFTSHESVPRENFWYPG